MNMLLEAILAVFMVVGSLLAASIFCGMIWEGCLRVRHPEGSAFILVAIAALAVVVGVPHSPFLTLALAYAVAAAVPLWFAGRAWRRSENNRKEFRGKRTKAIFRRDP
ncbi:hypothetical protein LWE61_20125 [Sphingobium sufflavum]|uniref:hypothetical protein n=1 Tax=Sphingobium sufflavum TaxID=1129547 RepID=UPI001F360390|nr:hypothetical protein [Sphingobium sufflavum]MCE7798840.1 hypothetical protein [Sphingobium sufflavum]